MNHDSEDGLLWHCQVVALILQNLPLNAHTNHHIRSAIREATKKVSDATHFSKSAHEVYRKSRSLAGTVLEHVIPVSVINSKVDKLPKRKMEGKPTAEDIAAVIREWTVLARVTPHEHDDLRRAGLHQNMPSDWDGQDKFGRYRKCNIKLLSLDELDLVP